MTQPVNDDRLWTPRELARFLGYSETTIARMVTQQPDKLPPRVMGLARPRWLPSAALEWVRQNTIRQIGGEKRGRRRSTI